MLLAPDFRRLRIKTVGWPVTVWCPYKVLGKSITFLQSYWWGWGRTERLTWNFTTETSDGWSSGPWLLWSSWESVDEVWRDSLLKLGLLFVAPDVKGLLPSTTGTETLPPHALWCFNLLSANIVCNAIILYSLLHGSDLLWPCTQWAGTALD